jgi:hypothetical protein
MSATSVEVAFQVRERAAELLEHVKTKKDTIRLKDADMIRSAVREAEGYLISVRKVLDGRPL